MDLLSRSYVPDLTELIHTMAQLAHGKVYGFWIRGSHTVYSRPCIYSFGIDTQRK
jgi:hypothetical protein